MVYVCGQHKAIAVAQQVQKLLIDGLGYGVISVALDIAAPKRPIFLERVIRVETAGVHVGKAVACGESPKSFSEALARIGVAGSGGKTRAGADYHASDASSAARSSAICLEKAAVD